MKLVKAHPYKDSVLLMEVFFVCVILKLKRMECLQHFLKNIQWRKFLKLIIMGLKIFAKIICSLNYYQITLGFFKRF